MVFLEKWQLDFQQLLACLSYPESDDCGQVPPSQSPLVRDGRRFVRLPIPGCSELNLLNARYADFEGQGGQMLRVPFWRGRELPAACAARTVAI